MKNSCWIPPCTVHRLSCPNSKSYPVSTLHVTDETYVYSSLSRRVCSWQGIENPLSQVFLFQNYKKFNSSCNSLTLIERRSYSRVFQVDLFSVTRQNIICIPNGSNTCRMFQYGHFSQQVVISFCFVQFFVSSIRFTFGDRIKGRISGC